MVLGPCEAHLGALTRFWVIFWSWSGPTKCLADPQWPYLVDFGVMRAVRTPYRPTKVDGGYRNRSWVVLGACGAHLGALASFWAICWSLGDLSKCLAAPGNGHF